MTTRHTSSDSISEDDVFTSVTSTEGSSLSEKEELSVTSTALKPPLPGGTKDGKSKKKKSKLSSGGRQRKGSGGSGSDGEGKGKRKSHSKSSSKKVLPTYE